MLHGVGSSARKHVSVRHPQVITDDGCSELGRAGRCPRMTGPDAPGATTRVRSALIPLRILLCSTMALGTATYGTISPLLPLIVRDLGVHHSDIGLITGAFTAGMLPPCLALMLTRRQPNDLWLVCGGLISLMVGALTLAGPASFGSVLAGRFLMGIGSGLCFSSGSRWLARSAPGRETVYFGLSWGMLSVGEALGPGIGSFGVRYGFASVHIALAVTFLVFLVFLAATGSSQGIRRSARPQADTGSSILPLFRRPPFLRSMSPLIVPALALGVFFTVSPLRLAQADHLGWVAPTFIAVAILGAAASPLAGALLRRINDRLLTRVSLLAGAGLMLVPASSTDALSTVTVTVLVLGVSCQFIVVGAGETTRRVGDALGGQDASSVIVPLAFAIFETIGAALSTQADAISHSLPFLALAAISVLCVVTLGKRDGVPPAERHATRPAHDNAA